MTSTDQQFSQIAEEAGIEGGADALRDIFRRVQATPKGTDPDAWVALAAPSASAELQARLVAACEAAQAEELPYDPARLTALKDNLETQSIQGFLVPQADAHQGEYIASAGQRLHWLTGFAGSAGTALMFKGRTILFVDGRYTLQAAMQFEGSAVEVRHFMEPPLAEWLVEAASDSDRIGYDPALHSVAQIDSLRKSLDGSGIELVALAKNPLDRFHRGQHQQYGGSAEHYLRPSWASRLSQFHASAALGPARRRHGSGSDDPADHHYCHPRLSKGCSPLDQRGGAWSWRLTDPSGAAPCPAPCHAGDINRHHYRHGKGAGRIRAFVDDRHGRLYR